MTPYLLADELLQKLVPILLLFEAFLALVRRRQGLLRRGCQGLCESQFLELGDDGRAEVVLH